MVIIYDLTTLNIISTEDNTQVLIMPFNMSPDEQTAFYLAAGQGYTILNEELGVSVYNNTVSLDANGNFLTLVPIIPAPFPIIPTTILT